jgi:hypothetical protein
LTISKYWRMRSKSENVAICLVSSDIGGSDERA